MGKTNPVITQLKDTYPGNTKKTQEVAPVKDQLKPVVTSKVKRKKKSMSKRIAETFVEDDVENVFAYIIQDVLVPAAKTTISDMISGGIELLLFGENRGSRTTRNGSKSYVSYNNKSSIPRGSTREFEKRNRAMHQFDDIIIDSRGEAEDVLSRMVDLIEEYGVVTVADFYDLVDITGSFTDQKYGWTNLSRSVVSRNARGGYVINLPKTEVV